MNHQGPSCSFLPGAPRNAMCITHSAIRPVHPATSSGSPKKSGAHCNPASTPPPAHSNSSLPANPKCGMPISHAPIHPRCGCGSGSGFPGGPSSSDRILSVVRWAVQGMPNEKFRSLLNQPFYHTRRILPGAPICRPAAACRKLNPRSHTVSGDPSMLVVMQSHATEEQIRAVCQRIERLGLKAHPMPGFRSAPPSADHRQQGCYRPSASWNPSPVLSSASLSASLISSCIRDKTKEEEDKPSILRISHAIRLLHRRRAGTNLPHRRPPAPSKPKSKAMSRPSSPPASSNRRASLPRRRALIKPRTSPVQFFRGSWVKQD